MHNTVLQKNIVCFAVLFLFFTIITHIEASTLSNQPAPLRNQALIFESSGSSFRETRKDISPKKQYSAKKKTLSKTPYRNKYWQVEAVSYDIPIR